MSRIGGLFLNLRQECRKALVPYVTAGDPRPDTTVALMHEMVAAGADIIELGVPFSDPMADGPVIQRATERALLHNVSLHDVLEMVRQFRDKDANTPVVLMGYLNPVEVMGYAAFAGAASDAGVDGVLTVDMPPEESAGLRDELKQREIDPIFLLAPTTGDERIRMIDEDASGFVYYVSLKGVTGAASLDVDGVRKRVEHIRSLTDLPVGVGFGINDATSASAVASFADAVVVGSALIREIEANQDSDAAIQASIRDVLSSMRQALDNVSR